MSECKVIRGCREKPAIRQDLETRPRIRPESEVVSRRVPAYPPQFTTNFRRWRVFVERFSGFPSAAFGNWDVCVTRNVCGTRT